MPWLTHAGVQGHSARIRVISILGRQSCGKSTLLNIMFGCSLATGQGQVTRGVHMQLVPCSGDRAGCEFLLILDTEGLQ